MSVYTEQRLRLHRERLNKRKGQKQLMPPAPCIYIVKNEPMILNGPVSKSPESVFCSIALPQSRGFVFEDILVYLNENGETVITSKRADKIIRAEQNKYNTTKTWKSWIFSTKPVLIGGIIISGLASVAIYFA